jgi:2-succinyl-6-hydroxy-2,4-cyclohexadiene-1-carboxylate synthase
VRVVFVPGFSQPASVWRDVLAVLPPDLDAVALEVPDGEDFAATAGALGDAGGTGVYVGYSMGGRLTLELTITRPELVTGLVMVSASPGIADAAKRAARVASDSQLAAGVERDGVASFLERWVAQPLFATVPPERAGLAARVEAMTEARLVHQLTALGQGAMPPAWEKLCDVEQPVLLLTGSLDAKYDTIAREMATRLARSEHHRLAGGHALLLEQPEAVAGEIVDFAHAVGAP